MNGTKILLKLKVGDTYKYLLGQTSATHDISVDTYETTNKLSGDAKTFEVARYSTSIKADCRIDKADATLASYEDVRSAAKSLAPIAYYYGDDITIGSKYASGTGIITKIGHSAPDGDAITFSVEIQVTGEEDEEIVTT